MSELQVGRVSTNVPAQILAAIFADVDTIDANRFIYKNANEKDDILNLLLDDKGEFSPAQTAKNVAFCEVDSKLARSFELELSKAGVSIGRFDNIQPARTPEGLARQQTFFIVPQEQRFTFDSICDEFVKSKSERYTMTPRELMDWLRVNEGDVSRVAGVEVDKGLYDYIERVGLLSIPRAVMGENELDGTVHLRMPWSMADGALDTIKIAETLYTGNFKKVEDERTEQDKSVKEHVVANAKNDLYNCVLVDRENPSRYIQIDRDGFRMYIDMEKPGTDEVTHHLIDRGLRNDRDFEQHFYNTLSMIGKYKELVGLEKDTQLELRNMQKQGQELRGITAEERALKLKSEHFNHFMRASEILGRDYQVVSNVIEQQKALDKGRMIDDAIKIGNQQDRLTAIGLGLSAAAGDLRGDLAQIKGMLTSSIASEMTKDLSDLYGKPGWDDYLSSKLCLSIRDESYRTEVLNEFQEMVTSITKETHEVQDLFRQEFNETIRDVFERDYRYNTETLSIEDIDLRQEIVTHEKEVEIDFTR